MTIKTELNSLLAMPFCLQGAQKKIRSISNMSTVSNSRLSSILIRSIRLPALALALPLLTLSQLSHAALVENIKQFNDAVSS
ncbi:MAG: hypothetical protein CMP20_14635, partial [Rickettsiales bacterium]|nr:hypothetical protein [Rickettsiales bacterium]